MKKETRWSTYDGVDYYDSARLDWKFSKIDNSREWFKYFEYCLGKKEKQVKNGM